MEVEIASIRSAALHTARKSAKEQPLPHPRQRFRPFWGRHGLGSLDDGTVTEVPHLCDLLESLVGLEEPSSVGMGHWSNCPLWKSDAGEGVGSAGAEPWQVQREREIVRNLFTSRVR